MLDIEITFRITGISTSWVNKDTAVGPVHLTVRLTQKNMFNLLFREDIEVFVYFFKPILHSHHIISFVSKRLLNAACFSRIITCTANEGPVRIKYKCLVLIYVLPEMKTARPRYFHNRIIMFCLPVSTFMYLWVIYIWFAYFAAAK